MNIDEFEANRESLIKQLESYNEVITQLFEQRLAEVSHIIRHLIKINARFFHPDLDQNTWTTVGAIIGRDYTDPDILYVYNGTESVVYKVDIAQDRKQPTDAFPISFYRFFSHCDLNFAQRGIDHIKGSFSRILNDLQQQIAKKKKFIEG